MTFLQRPELKIGSHHFAKFAEISDFCEHGTGSRAKRGAKVLDIVNQKNRKWYWYNLEALFKRRKMRIRLQRTVPAYRRSKKRSPLRSPDDVRFAACRTNSFAVRKKKGLLICAEITIMDFHNGELAFGLSFAPQVGLKCSSWNLCTPVSSGLFLSKRKTRLGRCAHLCRQNPDFGSSKRFCVDRIWLRQKRWMCLFKPNSAVHFRS